MNSSVECIHTIFEQHAAGRPGATALVQDGECISYGELDRRANRLAHYLRQLGIGPESRVAVHLECSFELVVALLGILKAGGAYLPLDSTLPTARQGFMLEVTGAAALVTRTHLGAGKPGVGPLLISLQDAAGAIAGQPSTPPESGTTVESLAFVTFSSGSTGRPKGALIPHRSVSGFVLSAASMWTKPDDVFLYHSPTLDEALALWTPLLCGASCVLLPELRPDLARIAEAVAEHGITTLFLSGGLFQAILEEAPAALVGLKRLLIGGETPSLAHVRRALETLPGTALINGYGPGECAAFSTCFPVPSDFPKDARALPIGRSVGDRRVYLLDAHMRRVPIGVQGEIYIGGPAVARGYAGEAALTAKSFLPDPFSGVHGARLYRTGDFARLLQSGMLELIGRHDNQIRLRGFQVELGEVESQIKAHPAVRDVACLCCEGPEGADKTAADTRILAFVVPESRAVDELRSADQVGDWQRVFDESVYRTGTTPVDPLFNTAGWSSSYDGTPISVEEMRIWAEDILAQVRSMEPRSILEIGCGNGMLLLQLARGVEAYTGTDISRSALDYVKGQIERQRPDYDHVQLLQQHAADFTGTEPKSRDAIILSSVVQYFPSIDYLLQVLDGCIEVLRPGGFILLGDLRSLPLAEAFHSSVQLAKAGPSTTAAQLRQQVRQQAAQDTELFIDPALFPALRHRYPAIGDVRIRLQRGRTHNELTKFRYSVVLSTQPLQPRPVVEPAAGIEAAADIAAHLRAKPTHLQLEGLRNARLVVDLDRRDRLARAEPDATIGRVLSGAPDEAQDHDRDAVDPEELSALAEEHGYRVELAWSHEDAGRFDAAFTREDVAATALPTLALKREPPRVWQSYANQPLQAGERARLPSELRRYLDEQLPDYMIPASFVVLDQLPRTCNGKLDRKALLNPAGSRVQTGPVYVAPRSALEQLIANYYAELLGFERIGIHDNFFDLGGHSLLATRLAAKVRKTLKVGLPLRSLFEEPTVAGLARLLAEQETTPRQTERIAEFALRVAELPPEEVRNMLQARRDA